MANGNYRYASRMRILEDLETEGIPPWDIAHFFERTQIKLNKILLDTMKRMQRNYLLHYSEKWVAITHINKEYQYRVASIAENETIEMVRKNLFKKEGYEYGVIPFGLHGKFFNQQRIYTQNCDFIENMNITMIACMVSAS